MRDFERGTQRAGLTEDTRHRDGCGNLAPGSHVPDGMPCYSPTREKDASSSPWHHLRERPNACRNKVYLRPGEVLMQQGARLQVFDLHWVRSENRTPSRLEMPCSRS